MISSGWPGISPPAYLQHLGWWWSSVEISQGILCGSNISLGYTCDHQSGAMNPPSLSPAYRMAWTQQIMLQGICMDQSFCGVLAGLASLTEISHVSMSSQPEESFQSVVLFFPKWLAHGIRCAILRTIQRESGENYLVDSLLHLQGCPLHP